MHAQTNATRTNRRFISTVEHYIYGDWMIFLLKVEIEGSAEKSRNFLYPILLGVAGIENIILNHSCFKITRRTCCNQNPLKSISEVVSMYRLLQVAIARIIY